MHRRKIFSSGIVLGALVALSLILISVLRHRASVEGSGIGLLRADVALLVLYGFAGMIFWRLKSASSITAAMVGAQIGLVIGAIGIANHLVEAFIPARPFVLVISPVLLTLALLGMAGATARERSGSLLPGVAAGICSAIVAVLILLGFAISFNLLFATRVDWQLREAFATSGMNDPAAFRVRNILESTSEILVRMPLLAICLAFAGAVIQSWMSRESRRAVRLAATVLTPTFFALGAAALWHASAIDRAARPPFVLSGVLLTGFALCAAYPIWSAFRGPRRSSRTAGNS